MDKPKLQFLTTENMIYEMITCTDDGYKVGDHVFLNGETGNLEATVKSIEKTGTSFRVLLQVISSYVIGFK